MFLSTGYCISCTHTHHDPRTSTHNPERARANTHKTSLKMNFERKYTNKLRIHPHPPPPAQPPRRSHRGDSGVAVGRPSLSPPPRHQWRGSPERRATVREDDREDLSALPRAGDFALGQRTSQVLAAPLGHTGGKMAAGGACGAWWPWGRMSWI